MLLAKSMFSLVCIFIHNSSCKYTCYNSKVELSLGTIVSQLLLVVLICYLLILNVFFSFKGVPGEGGAAGATGPRVS